MNNLKSRVFVKHAKRVFDPNVLVELRSKLTQLESDKSFITNTSEREEKAIRRGESSDKLRMQNCWYDVWRYPISMESLIEVVYPFTYVIFPVQVRHISKPVGQAVPWHQDAGYIRLLPQQRQHNVIITCFVPLEDEPYRHTTIQFSLDNSDQNSIFEHKPMSSFGAGLDIEISNTFYHDLNLGDALVFGDLTFHRTYTPTKAIVERRSLEFRLCIPSDALADKDYFDIQQQVFIKKNGSTRREINV